MKPIEEAVEWVRRCPDPMPGETSEIEIRPLDVPQHGARWTPVFKLWRLLFQGICRPGAGVAAGSSPRSEVAVAGSMFGQQLNW